MGVSRGGWALCALALSLPAVAQTEESAPPAPTGSKRFYIGPQLGVYTPTAAAARQRFSSAWTNVGVGVGPISVPSTEGETFYDFTFISSRSRQPGAGSTLNNQTILMIPVGMMYRRGFGSAQGQSSRAYWGGSAGVVVTHMESQLDQVAPGWRMGYGASAILGVVLSRKAYAQARYFQTTRVKGIDLSGLNMSVGLRF